MSVTINNIIYTLDSPNLGEATVTGYSGIASGSLGIPDTIISGSSYDVTAIGNFAFQGLNGFTGSLTIGNNVQTIGNNAFAGCEGFTGSLTIPNSVTSIGYYAFDSCTGFNGTLTIGNNVQTIGENAFALCVRLTGNLIIPNSVTTLGSGAFQECIGFTGTLTIGNGIETIESGVFAYCSGLTGNLTIPNYITSVGALAFEHCNGFSSLTIGNGIETIEFSTFSHCTGLTGNLYIPTSVTSIGGDAFYFCSGITSITVTYLVTSIGAGAFNSCSNAINVIIEDQNICAVETDSFDNYSQIQGSSIKFYSTANASNLTSNWPTISTYYADQIYEPNPACFCKGTKILSLNQHFQEEYVSIENLKKGDLVKTFKHGYRKIDLIGKNQLTNNPDKFTRCMYKMQKTVQNGLIDDLIVTGGHSILVDDLGDYKEENDKKLGETQMIDGKYLLLSSISKEFVKLENRDNYTYYHLVLENNGNDEERFGIWANGILVETPPKKTFITFNLTLN